ncbi:MAG: hypothetical protein JWO80_6433, partial [Bryobacterales bacterium]|nr:hypothetical protein [Bryobacterales bacterium]
LGGIGGYRGPVTGKPEILQMGVIGWVKAMVLRVWAILYFPINWSTQPELWLALLLGLYVVSLVLLSQCSSDGRSRRFALAFTFLASLPAVGLLLIGPDLQKARLLYLPSVGYCFWAAVSTEAIRKPWVRWSIAATVLCFHIAALEHNLSIWRHVSSIANRTCASAAAQTANAKGVAVAALPESINGVYFFANGFAECVEMHSRLPAK